MHKGLTCRDLQVKQGRRSGLVIGTPEWWGAAWYPGITGC